MKQYVKPETESFQTAPSSALCASANVGVTLGTMKVKSFNKTPILVFALLSGLLMLPSCKNGNGDIDQPAAAFKKGEVVSITTDPLGAGNKGPRRVQIAPDQTGEEAQLVWTEGDQLRVIVPTTETPYPYSDFNLTAGAGDKTGTFTGTMPAEGSEFFLAYPCGNVTGSNWNATNKTVKFQHVKVPNVQDFKVGETSFNSGIMPVVGYGKAEDGVLTGYTTIVGGALRVKLTNKTGDAITFNKIQLLVHDACVGESESAAKTSVWSSGYTVDYNVESKTVTPSGTSADNNNIVLNLSQDVTLANDATSGDFYFVMVAPLYFKTKAISGGDASFTVYLFNHEGKVTSPSDLETEQSVATTSFNYNIDIQPGEIAEGTLEMTKITD